MAENPPIRKACDRCHSQKLCCRRTGTENCQRCSKAGLKCTSSPSLRNRSRRKNLPTAGTLLSTRQPNLCSLRQIVPRSSEREKSPPLFRVFLSLAYFFPTGDPSEHDMLPPAPPISPAPGQHQPTALLTAFDNFLTLPPSVNELDSNFSRNGARNKVLCEENSSSFVVQDLQISNGGFDLPSRTSSLSGFPADWPFGCILEMDCPEYEHPWDILGAINQLPGGLPDVFAPWNGGGQ